MCYCSKQALTFIAFNGVINTEELEQIVCASDDGTLAVFSCKTMALETFRRKIVGIQQRFERITEVDVLGEFYLTKLQTSFDYFKSVGKCE